MCKLSAIFYLILAWIPFVAKGQDIDYNSRNIVVNTPDSTIKAKVIVKTDKLKTNPEYVYYWYYGGTINHNLGGVSGKILHGKYEVFDSQQKLITQGIFQHGLMTGIWNRWFANGNIREVLPYKNGQLYGKVKVYTEDGKLAALLKYQHGKLNGKSYFYQRDTTITRMYRNGIEVVKKKKEPKKLKQVLAKDVKKGNDIKQKKDSTPQMELQTPKKENQIDQGKSKKKWWQFTFLKKKSGDQASSKKVE